MNQFAVYTHPMCALYRADVARRYKFHPRPRPPEWLPYIQVSDEDPWRGPRQQHCDVGEALYIQAVEDGHTVVTDFWVEHYGTHLWTAAPFGSVDYNNNYYRQVRWKGIHWFI